jgi:hypothetical protein
MAKEEFKELISKLIIKLVGAAQKDPEGKHPAWREIDALTKRILAGE